LGVDDFTLVLGLGGLFIEMSAGRARWLGIGTHEDGGVEDHFDERDSRFWVRIQ
jgi:hypothetical protein